MNEVIYYLNFASNCILMLIFTLCFTWRFIGAIQSLLGRSRMDLMFAPYFLVTIENTSQYVLTWFLLGFGKFLGIAKAHMSPIPLHGTVVSSPLVVGVSLMSILQVGDWAGVSTPAIHYFFSYVTTTDQHQDSIQWAVLSLSEQTPWE